MASSLSLVDQIGTLEPLDPADITNARLTVCELAHDAHDAHMLLDALGIGDQP